MSAADLACIAIFMVSTLSNRRRYQMDGGNYPSGPASRYMHEEAMGRTDLLRLDETNKAHLREYVANVHTMEAITR